MAKETATYQQLRAILRKEGCPICRLGLAAVERYLDTMMWESSTDVNVHELLTASIGFCGRHSRQLLLFGGQRLAAAVVERAALIAAQQRLEHVVAEAGEPVPSRHGLWPWREHTSSQPYNWLALPDSVAPCPACARQSNEEARGIEELLAHWADVVGPLEAAGGLCLPHLVRTARMADVDQRQALLALQAKLWGELRDDLELFITQHKSHHHGEPIDEQARRAVERTIATLTGEYPVR